MQQNVRQLSKTFLPKHYNLTLRFEREPRTFSGEVTIQGTLTKNAASLPLHAKDLAFSEITIDNQTAAVTEGVNNEIEVTSANELAAGEHTITLKFSGKITDTMHGLYPCYFTLDEQNEELLATQFESHYAREVFPCVDEPAAKATFDVTVETEKGVTVLGNTPITAQKETDNHLVTSFETTPTMSTYLLAWVIGKLDYKEAKTSDGVDVRVYATPDNTDKLDFALETAVRTLELYNEYFDIPYPLPKCDMVALPDFSSGAMENWGCITYRESALFVDSRTSTSARQHVAEVIAHELAHQWFGNLVTMQWWNDLWLNESFASWMANYALAKLFPDWQIWTQFYNEETSYALDRDSLKSIQSVQQDVHHPDEIQTLFDPAIVYAKGANLVHMVHAYMGEDAFRNGLRAYMKQHAYGNTAAADLWKAWSDASAKDIGAFMTPWISQPGHPVVKVQLKNSTATLTQQRFINDPEEKVDDTVWPVPILAGEQITEALLEDMHADFATQSASKPLMLNQGRTAFYIPLYEPVHLEKLAALITDGKMEVTDRLALLNEAYDLAKAGQQPTLQMIKLLEAYKDETSEPVWNSISGAIGGLKMFVEDDEALQAKLKSMTVDIAKAQYTRLGWERIAGEPHFDELLRPTILGLMAYGEDPEVLAKGKELLEVAQKPEDILGDIRGVVFSICARHGDDQTFDKLYEWVKHERSPEVRSQLTGGLCSAKQEAHIKKLVKILVSPYVKHQDVFYWVAYLARNKHARSFIWQWNQDNWEWITKTFSSDGHYTIFPRYLAAMFNTPEGLAEYRKFFDPMATHPMLGREIQQSIESIKARMLWRQRDFADVAKYLQSR